MFQKLVLIGIFSLFSLSGFSRGPVLPETIPICDDGGEWPPFSYYKREKGVPTKKIIGLSVDVINVIFKENNLKYTLRLIPWKRCFKSVQRGNNYLMFLSGGKNKEREETLYISEPYYSMHPHIFYSNKNFPTPPVIKNVETLKKYRLCGLRGFNYSVFNIKPNEIKDNFGDHKQLFTVVAKGRCDFSINRFEIIKGLEKIGKISLPGNVKSVPIEFLSNEPFHMMFSKNSQGKKLKKIIDSGILKLKKSGTLNELLSQYLR